MEKPEVDPHAVRLVTGQQAVRLRAAPYAIEDGDLRVAMLDTADLVAADEISITAGMPVERIAVSQDVLAELIRDHYGATSTEMAAHLGGDENDTDELVANLEAIEADDLHRMAEKPSLINLVNLLIIEAVRARASDVHIEPFERELKIRRRIDGVLFEQDSPPKHLQPAITSRIKIMAGMNIAERFMPQDGHIALRYEGRKVDIRVSTAPTLYGESVVMRILDKESISLELAALGLREKDRAEIDRLIGLPHGMLLVTGPTGSGKTTTLYAALTKLADPSKKILTIEDPVEYELAGVNQMPVNPKRGLSFATGLRHILRQDPDVVMVGEIRDGETADIAVRAALTGHFLLSTLHTNTAVNAIGRLIDMGVEPFLLASVLEGVLAQRLGRRNCTHCVRSMPMPEGVLHRLSKDELALFPNNTCLAGAGCDKCNGSGYFGRIGFHELLTVNRQMREAISNRVSAQEMIRLANSDHISMRRDGILKAAEGSTTIEQVLRATQDVESEA